MDLSKLKDKFEESDLEWRLGNKVTPTTKRARALVYITARAVMDRLDSVCGPENWKVQYTHSNGGVMCKLSIKIGDHWLDKEDGAEPTDIEAFKGGISDALKRAAVCWGIGRYLYGMGETWVDILENRTPNSKQVRTTDNKYKYWLPPTAKEKTIEEKITISSTGEDKVFFDGQEIKPQVDLDFKMPFGKYKGCDLLHIYDTDPGYLKWIETKYKAKDAKYESQAAELRDKAKSIRVAKEQEQSEDIPF